MKRLAAALRPVAWMGFGQSVMPQEGCSREGIREALDLTLELFFPPFVGSFLIFYCKTSRDVGWSAYFFILTLKLHSSTSIAVPDVTRVAILMEEARCAHCIPSSMIG